MKNNKGFTLIEILAVVAILGVLMIVAIPNVVSVIEKNKKNTLVEDAKTLIALAQYKVRVDTSIDLPMDKNTILVMTMDFLDTNQLDESPYGQKYNHDKSFVAVTLEDNDSGELSRNYYVHLVACADSECVTKNSEKNNGINLTKYQELNQDNSISKVIKGANTYISLVDDDSSIKTYFEDNYGIKNITNIIYKNGN